MLRFRRSAPEASVPLLPITGRAPRGARVLELTAIVGLGFSLRPGISSVGPALESLSGDLSLGSTAAGALLTLPVLALAFWGLVAPALAAWVGLHRLIMGCVVLIAVAGCLRVVSDSGALFFLVTAVGLSAAAVGNVFLPVLTARHFPDRLETVSAVVITAVLVGAAAGSLVTPWLLHVFGGWKGPLLFWGLAVVPVVLLWTAMVVRGTSRPDVARRAGGMRSVARQRSAWLLAVCFGIQVMHGFVALGWVPVMLSDRGATAAVGGLTVGVFSLAAIPLSLVVPRLVARRPASPLFPAAFAAAATMGWVGLSAAPLAAPLLWGGLVGVGAGLYPWTMTVIAVRTRASGGGADLSGFVQTVGYGVAAMGPVGVGLMRDANVAWPAICGLLAASGLVCGALAFGVVGRIRCPLASRRRGARR